MMTLITGTPGAGKTAWLVQELTRLPSQRKIFVHGIPELKIPHEVVYCKSPLCDLCGTVLDDDKFFFLEHWPVWATSGSLVVADEVQRIWPAANSASSQSEAISRLQTHRHLGLDFWLISQSPKLLHTGVRTMIGRHIHLVAKWSGRSEYEWPEINDNTGSRGDAVVRPYKLPKQIFKLYKSSSFHTTQTHRKPIALYAFIAVLLIVSVMGYRVYARMSSRVDPELAVDVDKVDSVDKTKTTVVNSVPVTVKAFPDFVPVIPNLPASAPAYAALVEVTAIPHLIGCVSTPDHCQCYSRQAVHVAMSQEFCKNFIAGNYFNPFREKKPLQVADNSSYPATSKPNKTPSTD